MNPEQCDRVSRGRWSRPKLMIEYQPIGADGIAEVNSGIASGQEVDQFTVVSGRKHNVKTRPPRLGDKLQQNCASRGDALYRIRPSKQLV